MKETYTVESSFETGPTGSEFDTLLLEVIEVLEGKEPVTGKPVAVNKQAYVMVKKNGSDYTAKIECEYGVQEQGFLIDVSVKSEEGFSRADAQEVLRSVHECIREVFPVENKLE